MSPSFALKYASWSASLTPSLACATKFRNGAGCGKSSARPCPIARASSITRSSVV
ncbi:putative syringomycin synthetase [Burkholderia pseudomallei]|nr:putative syringomycin synthetase [Burkholderia pseudomallei]